MPIMTSLSVPLLYSIVHGTRQGAFSVNIALLVCKVPAPLCTLPRPATTGRTCGDPVPGSMITLVYVPSAASSASRERERPERDHCGEGDAARHDEEVEDLVVPQHPREGIGPAHGVYD